MPLSSLQRLLLATAALTYPELLMTLVVLRGPGQVFCRYPRIRICLLGVLAELHNSSIPEVKQEESGVQGHPQLYTKFKASQDYRKTGLKIPKTN